MSSFYPLENSVERLVPRSSDTSTPDYGICKISNGDVWKAFISFRQDPDLDMVTGNFDWGCGVIRVLPNTDQLVLEKPPFSLTYADFERNRQTWLRLLTLNQLILWLDKGDSILKTLTFSQQDQDTLDEKEIINFPKPDLK